MWVDTAQEIVKSGIDIRKIQTVTINKNGNLGNFLPGMKLKARFQIIH